LSRHKAFSDELKAQILELYLAEKSIPEIARTLHVARPRIYEVIRADGVPQRGRDIPNIHRRKISDETRAEVAALYRAGCFTTDQLAERFKIGVGSVARILMHEGICRGKEQWGNKNKVGRGSREDNRPKVQNIIESLPTKLAAKKLGLKTGQYVVKLRRRWGIPKPPRAMVENE
jgi:transposase-like protein